MAGSKAFENSTDVMQRLLPSLRRFAHAIVGGQGRSVAAESLLETALDRMGAQGDPSEAAIKAALYKSVVTVNRGRLAGRATDPEPFSTPIRGIAQAIDRLPLDQREVLLLVVLEQLSYEQAATVLGIPRSSIVARLLRARAAIASSDDAPHHRPTYLRIVK